MKGSGPSPSLPSSPQGQRGWGRAQVGKPSLREEAELGFGTRGFGIFPVWFPWGECKEHTELDPPLANAAVGGGTLVEDLDFPFFGLSLFLKHDSSAPVILALFFFILWM